ncbi:Card1-like endonuclease domain-containing protein [Desulfolucanica intricata]|uniref:Card1-like endonuclease domain-containing protein n=1 Tax=Desulfolucanica intricata TaxID=1285191 RepID=UPI00082E01A4|nr:DUF1887 family protein [Desulfolucanica intricata]
MQYNFTDLVLLIGTNTLPNYVVAKYFIMENQGLKKIWVVHSEATPNQVGTKDLAQNIAEVLREEFNKKIQIEYISLEDISSAEKIMLNIKNKLIKKLSGKNNSAHLNYTGGTKAMAVHVYRVLERELGSKCSFSYLDARDFKIKDDYYQAVTTDLRKNIGISLNNLMKLHGYKKLDEQDNPDWIDALNYFSKLINKEKLSIYLKWVSNCLQKYYYWDSNFIKQSSKFLYHNQLINNNNELDLNRIKTLKQEFKNRTPHEVMELLKRIPKKYSLLDENGEMWIPDLNTNNKSYSNRLKDSIVNFLHGKWLEAYIFKFLKDKISSDNYLSEKDIPMELNWVITKGTSKFELDVIVINGYQICGISCTTSKNQSLCKEKGFEVLYRVKQIGGEEAKAILITCLPEEQVLSLDEDLSTITGSRDKKLLIIGISKLNDGLLWEELSRHIWG